MTADLDTANVKLQNARAWILSIVKPHLLAGQIGPGLQEGSKKFIRRKKPIQMLLGLGPKTQTSLPNIWHDKFLGKYITQKMEAIMDELEQGKSEIKWEDPTLQELEEVLRRRFPHGHRGFIPMTIKEMDLHSKKNHDYAHGGKATGNFDRVAAIVAMYPGLDISKPQNIAVVYLLKQLDAALWLECQGHSAVVQGQDERWEDVSVYAKIVRLLLGGGK